MVISSATKTSSTFEAEYADLMRSIGLSGQLVHLHIPMEKVIVFASTCHDSVMVGLCAQVCLLNLLL